MFVSPHRPDQLSKCSRGQQCESCDCVIFSQNISPDILHHDNHRANPTNGLIFKTSNFVLVPDHSLEEVHQFHLLNFGFASCCFSAPLCLNNITCCY